MRNYLFVAAAVAALAFAPAAFAGSGDSTGDMGHGTAMGHGCTNGKDAMGHACKHDAMGHDAMGHSPMAHGSTGSDPMGHTVTNAN